MIWISSLLPNKDLTASLIRYFAGYDSTGGSQSSVDRLNRRIKAELGDDQSRLLILVDDMERADPSVVRSLLPVIDGLEKFEDCYFVFALDPDRITSAFSEKSVNESSTSGYLDKVFDLKIDLPSAREADICNLAKMRVDPSVTPVLKNCLPTLEPLLSANPRKLEKFLAAAIAKERMFFHRFSRDEPRAKALFVCLLIENEFKGFVSLLASEELRESFKSLIYKNISNPDWDPQGETEYSNLKAEICDVLSISQDAALLKRFEYLFVELLKLRGGRTGLLSRMDLEWIERGHTQLELLAPNELQKARDEWVQSSGSTTLREILLKSIGEADFCDIEQCGHQLIREEVSAIEKISIGIYGEPDLPASVELHERIQNLLRQVAYSKRKSDEGLTYFGVDFFLRVAATNDLFSNRSHLGRGRLERADV